MNRIRGRDARSSPRRASNRAQSETIGVILILAITVVGTTSVVAFGGGAMEEIQSHSQVERAGHAMTVFDANAATVGLGDAAVRSVDFGGNDGSYEVDPTAGRITVTHVDYDGDGDSADGNDDANLIDDGTGDDDEQLYTGTLGAVVYRNGDTHIAYQGGGVWRRDADGGSTMLSPPEFHYRGATLTLPVLRVTGTADAAAGRPTATIKRDDTVGTTEVFPDPTADYPNADPDSDDDDMTYRNPTDTGRVVITVESEYYRAWGSYFESRTDGTVSYDHANGRVNLILVSTGHKGGFSMPAEGNSIDIRGLEGGHNLHEFGITIRPDDTDSAGFSNLQWSLWAEGDAGNEQFEMHVRRSGGSDCADPMTASLTIYYSDDGGNTYEGWYEDTAFETTCDADGNAVLDMDFSDDEDGDGEFDDDEVDDPGLTYTSLSSSDLTHFSPNGALASQPTTDGHTAVDIDSTEPVDLLFNHYFAFMGPDIELEVNDKNSNTVTEDASTGTIEYEGSGKYVTYLHVSENGITVELH